MYKRLHIRARTRVHMLTHACMHTTYTNLSSINQYFTVIRSLAGHFIWFTNPLYFSLTRVHSEQTNTVKH